jgi:hypothetical protein
MASACVRACERKEKSVIVFSVEKAARCKDNERV